MTKLTVPSQFNIFGVTYSIELLSGEELKRRDAFDGESGGGGREGIQLYGETAVDTKRIRLNQDIDSRRRAITLLHEIMHAAIGISGLSTFLSGNMEEALVTLMEEVIIQFMSQWGSEYLSAISIDGSDSEYLRENTSEDGLSKTQLPITGKSKAGKVGKRGRRE